MKVEGFEKFFCWLQIALYEGMLVGFRPVPRAMLYSVGTLVEHDIGAST